MIVYCTLCGCVCCTRKVDRQHGKALLCSAIFPLPVILSIHHSSAPIDHVHDDKSCKRTRNEYEGNAEEMEHSHI